MVTIGSKPPSDHSPESKLGLRGLQALDELSKLCERHTLIGLFQWLAAYKLIRIKSSIGAADVQIDLRELDCRATAHPGFSLSQLRRVAQRAHKLESDVARLRKTPLVQALVDGGIIPEGDLLATPVFFSPDTSLPFRGLALLPKAAKWCGPQKTPDSTRMRKNIHRFIHRQTGSWHDREFAAIYNDLFLGDQETEKDVQRWRSRHGMK